MSFPLIIFLYIYYLFLVVWAIFFLAGLYHMFRFGFKNITTVAITGVFIAVAVFMLATSFGFIFGINWQAEVSIFEGFFNKSIEIEF